MNPSDKWKEDRDEQTYTAYENQLLDQLGLSGESRRKFLGSLSAAGISLMASPMFSACTTPQGVAKTLPTRPEMLLNEVDVKFNVNGAAHSLTVDSRTTLLDTLREHLNLTGSKKGCNHGQCGACTVMIDGKRKLSCLTLAASCEDKEVTTVEGLAEGSELHPMQAAFLKNDGFQCGYCTPGQICSSVALLEEAKNGEASYVSEDFKTVSAIPVLSEEEIRERMSGNICRCGAYNNIVRAIQEVQSGEEGSPQWEFASEQQMEAARS